MIQRFYYLLLAFCSVQVLDLSAQSLSTFLFNEFMPGKVLLKNRQFAKGKFNYDGLHRQMHYLIGETDMIVENLQEIDTIYIGNSRYVPFDDSFAEVMEKTGVIMLVEHKKSIREQGKAGAMGMTTQGTVQAIDVNARYQRVNGEQNLDINIYKVETEHVYWVAVKGKWKSFHNSVTLLKLFPKKNQDLVKDRLKEMSADFSAPSSILELWSKLVVLPLQ